MERVEETLSGRELDFAIAVKAMGFRRELKAWYAPNGNAIEVFQIPQFSQSIEAAMLVIEKMRELDWGVVMQDSIGKLPWYVEFDNGVIEESATSDSLPEAISRAALAALAAQTEE